jgi:transposase InsO family protein
VLRLLRGEELDALSRELGVTAATLAQWRERFLAAGQASLRERFGGYEAEVARGLALRHDHGSQYLSDHFQGELRFLGIRSSPSSVAAAEGNGCAERFIRTLKEQLLWLESSETVEELRQALVAFKERYNRHWLVERHGHRSPAAVREALLQRGGVAAWLRSVQCPRSPVRSRSVSP